MAFDLRRTPALTTGRLRMRRGFALPAVLAVTGIVTIVFLVAMTALYSLTAEAASARSRVAFLQRALTAEATLSYMATTEPATTRGIAFGAPRPGAMADDEASGEGVAILTDEIRFDGSVYRMEASGPLIVRLRDQAGMINLSTLKPDQTARLAERLGAPDRVARTLPDRVGDFMDADGERRLGGAEARDYPEGAAPANRPFRRIDEFLSVLGARGEISSSRWRGLRDDLTVDRTSPRFNANTASETTLEVLFGADPRQAQRAVRQRQTAPFSDGSAFAAALGVSAGLFDPDTPLLFPSGTTIITLRDGLSPWVYRFRLMLSPRDLERPVWIDQTDMLEAPRRQAAETKNVPRLPYTPR